MSVRMPLSVRVAWSDHEGLHGRWSMVCAPFCVVMGAPVSAGGAVNRLRVGVQPRRGRRGYSPGFRPGSPARSALRRAADRAENSHSARRSPRRAWVARSGPRPIRLRPLLTANEVRGYGFRPPSGGRCCGRAGRAAATGTGRKKGGPANPWWRSWPGLDVGAIKGRGRLQCSGRPPMPVGGPRFRGSRWCSSMRRRGACGRRRFSG